MRVIKFRLWDGDDMYSWDELCTPFVANSHTSLIDLNGSTDEHFREWMQFTGLHDKNGKEIYEGDIVTQELDWVRITFEPKAVEYRNSGYYPFQYSGGGEYCAEYCTVVGNIYENPELLR